MFWTDKAECSRTYNTKYGHTERGQHATVYVYLSLQIVSEGRNVMITLVSKKERLQLQFIRLTVNGWEIFLV